MTLSIPSASRSASRSAWRVRALRALVLVGSTLAPLAAVPAQALQWDVPERGALRYTRTTERWSVSPAAWDPLVRVVAGAEDGGHEWRYFACATAGVPDAWQQPDFDDGDWALGRSEFGNDLAQRPEQRTRWDTGTLLLRARVDLGRRKLKALVLRLYHDDDVRVFAEGKLLFEQKGYGRDRVVVVAGDALANLPAGEALFAVQCVNTGGAQGLDIAIAAVPVLPPGVRNPEALEAAMLEAQQHATRVRGDLFGKFRPPALLLHGELDGARQRPVPPPADLRELAFWVACDLQKGPQGGAYAQDLPRLFRLGDLQLRGKVGPTDADGWQELDIAVKSPPAQLPRNDSKRFLDMFVHPHVLYALDGRLLIRRRLAVDGNRARVVECRCTLEGRVVNSKNRKDTAAELLQREIFAFDTVRDNQDGPFRIMVGRAIDEGASFLRRALANRADPDLVADKEGGNRSYNSGRLALGLLALIKAGTPKNDPVLMAALDELRSRTLVDTYSLGNAMMALEAFHAPANEFADLKAGTLLRAQRRAVPERDRVLLRRWADQLLSNVDTRVEPDSLLRFSYIREARFDNSVSQYGVLGLYSAHLCGVEIPEATWEAAANHWIISQCREGAPVQLELTDFRTLAAGRTAPELRRTSTTPSVRAAPWTYELPTDLGEDVPGWGSMTCAGITSLAICQAALLDLGKKSIKLQDDADAARSAGFAWLAQNLTVRCHPGALFRQQQWFFYYLYSLERAALLSNVALIQGRDWYFEGAMVLALTQEEDGSWPGEVLPDAEIERAAMAVLFLKRGTAPVLTGR